VVFRLDAGRGEYLLLKRAPHVFYGGIWQYVTGTVEPGEHTVATIMREVREETGLTPEALYRVPDVGCFYLAEDDAIHLVSVFAARVARDIPVRISGEHTGYDWQDRETAGTTLYWPFNRRMVNLVDDNLVQGELPDLWRIAL